MTEQLAPLEIIIGIQNPAGLTRIFMGLGRPRPVLPRYRGEGAPAPEYSQSFVFFGSVNFRALYWGNWEFRSHSPIDGTRRRARDRLVPASKEESPRSTDFSAVSTESRQWFKRVHALRT
jgi:hypothetical protein